MGFTDLVFFERILETELLEFFEKEVFVLWT
jgi:hypothetical protein